jgi:hypothetical protein
VQHRPVTCVQTPTVVHTTDPGGVEDDERDAHEDDRGRES